ncbi:MAG: hypothetical protein H6732_09740 [Alphaproteobacteria bacterium]|nr:hypothetical protein [Alphaproteobacteria bacterium]
MSRWLPPLVLACLGAAALCVRPIFSLDLWWHLSMGRAVWTHGARTVPEPVAYAGPDTYVDPEWVFDLLALGAWSIGGVTAVTLGVALAAGLHVALVAWLARVAGASAGASVALAAVVGAGTVAQFMPRPQILFLLLLPLALGLALRVRTREGGARTVALVGLHLVLAVWSQAHTSVVVAPPLVLALALLPWPEGRPLDAPTVLALLTTVCWPFAGPFGLEVVDQVLRHGAGDASRYISDMRRTHLVELGPTGPDGMLFVDLVVGGALAVAAWRRRLPLGALVAWVLGLALALTAVRFRSTWGVLAVPLLAAGLRGATLPAWATWAVAALLPSMAAVVAPQLGLGVDRGMVALDLADELARIPDGGRVIAEYDMGGVVGWRAGPSGWRVRIDGRTPVHFDADELFAYRKAVRDPAALELLLAQDAPRAVAMYRSRPTCVVLMASSSWGAVYTDERRVLFVKGAKPRVTMPCVLPEDPTPPSQAGVDRLEGWDRALADGRAAEVRTQLEPLVEADGHEADPRVRLRLAQACGALGDAVCVGREGWRSALQGQPALDLLRTHRAGMTPAQQRRVDALLPVLQGSGSP